jgi:hypothetical protein
LSQKGVSIQEGVISMSIIYVLLNGQQKMELKSIVFSPYAGNIIQSTNISVIPNSNSNLISNGLVVKNSPLKDIIEKREINTKIIAKTPELESQQEITLTGKKITLRRRIVMKIQQMKMIPNMIFSNQIHLNSA